MSGFVEVRLEPEDDLDEGSEDVAPPGNVGPEVNSSLLHASIFTLVSKERELCDVSSEDQDLGNENHASGWTSETLQGENSVGNKEEVDDEKDNVDASWFVMPSDGDEGEEYPSQHKEVVVECTGGSLNSNLFVLVHEGDLVQEGEAAFFDLLFSIGMLDFGVVLVLESIDLSHSNFVD
jgi:hypothetical protein